MDDEDVRRRFAEIADGLTIDDLRGVMEQIGRARLADYLDRDRPELRHPPRPDTVSFRVRADLVGAKPPIWRRLDLRSSMTLDVLHEVLQAAFGWTDSHLHRFSIGGDGWDHDAQLFLCPFDVDEGEDEGMPASEVRLEDSRGLDGAELLEIQGDPARFDSSEVNEVLADLRFGLREAGVAASVISIIERLRYLPGGDRVDKAARTLVDPQPDISAGEVDAALRAWTWFLRRAAGEGIELTAAGYVRPADVVEASAVVPAMGAWFGAHNREAQSGPLLHFREALVRDGFLRKSTGRLLVTRQGRAGARDAQKSWDALITRFRGVVDGTHTVRGRRGALSADYGHDAAICLLLMVAGGGRFSTRALEGRREVESTRALGLDDAAAWLTVLGWRRGDGPVEASDLYEESVRTVLENLWDGPRDLSDRGEMSDVARQFARDVLRRGLA